MNSGLYIILFWFNDDWGRYGRAYEHVATELSRLPEVTHVSCIFPPRKFSKQSDAPPLTVRTISEKLTLLTQSVLTDSKKTVLFAGLRSKMAKSRHDKHLTDYLSGKGFRKNNTLLWLFPPHPYIPFLMNKIPHRGVTIHMIDDFTKFNPEHELYKHAHEQYSRLGDWADIFITTSEANKENFSKYGKPCHMFWPAVDQSFIGVPDNLPSRKQDLAPRLGYVGYIMERTDLDLIRYIAESHPEWKVILVGPQYPDGLLDNSGLLALPNLDYLGPIPQEQVPRFLATLDVCLMPHRDTAYSRSMGPLKLYQYLASGKPIVTTNVAGLDLVKDLIHIADTFPDFVRAIELALATDDLDKSTKRIEAAMQHTWPIRVRAMFDTVAESLGFAPRSAN